MNRRGLGNMPFGQVPNSTLRAQAPQNVVGGNNNVQIQEARLPAASPLGLPFGSAYNLSFSYRASPQAALFQAVRSIYNRIQARVNHEGARRFRYRITYRDRTTLAMPFARTTTTSFSLVDGQDSFNNLWDSILFLFSSNDEIDLEDLIILVDMNVPLQGGGGNKAITSVLKTDYIHAVPTAVRNLCGWICLVMHILKHTLCQLDGMPQEFWNCFKIDSMHRRKKQLLYNEITEHETCTSAKFLSTYCGGAQLMDVTKDIPAFLRKFPQFRVVILDGSSQILEIHKGSQWHVTLNLNDDNLHNIYILHEIGWHHFDLISDIRAFIAVKNNVVVNTQKIFCHGCLKFTDRRQINQHSCEGTFKCDKCPQYFMDSQSMMKHQRADLESVVESQLLDHEISNDTECPNCHKLCYNGTCLSNHIAKCASHSKRIPCTNCSTYVYDLLRHNCKSNSVIKCSNCAQSMERRELYDHHCFVQKLPLEPAKDIDEELTKFYAFDFESMFVQEGTRTLSSGEVEPVNKHVVNCCVVRQFKTGTEWVFRDIASFTDWLDVRFKDTKGIMIAHNFKGYDGRLLYQHYIKVKKQFIASITWNGAKLMNMVVDNITFMDSVLHVQASLEQFPKIFGLDESQFAKGFFPYRFSTESNQTYIGPIPPKSMFDPDMMGQDKRKQFMKWHDEQQDKLYDFQAELLKYCKSDVSILAQAMEIYVREGVELNSGLNPLECVTVASYALKVYRTLHMPENKICVLKEDEHMLAKQSLHGGRTDVRKMIKFYTQTNVDDGIYAKYQDVQSLYPTVQFFKPLPCGKPKVHIFWDDKQERCVRLQPSLEEVSKWFGLIECDIEPSKYMHHPVLLKKNEDTKKLVASLEPLKRTVITSAELHQALKSGYILTQVYKYHEYEQSTDLFKSYIRTYLKIKIQCSGMPSYIKTDSDWEEFAKYHEDVLGVKLERDKMVKNAGKKQLAKMMLNSLWGKFAENRNYSQCVMVDRNNSSYAPLEKKWENNLIDVQMHLQVSDGLYMIIFTDNESKNYSKKRACKTNLTLASFVTAWGALTLWEEMDKLGHRVLYHDTDSIIYEHDPHKYNIPEGRYLGEWEDETDGKPIVKFTSTGPKTYSYAYLDKTMPSSDENIENMCKLNIDFWEDETKEIVKTLKYTSKCKGFTLNAYNSQRINFKTMHQLIIGEIPYLESKTLQFRWDRLDSTMRTSFEMKQMRFTYDKGVIDTRDYGIYPYGYDKYGSFDEVIAEPVYSRLRRW